MSGEGAELAAEILARSSGRTITEEWRDYPDEGFWRPAKRLLWYVVREPDGSEVTRGLRREIAERYLRPLEPHGDNPFGPPRPLLDEQGRCTRHPAEPKPWCLESQEAP